MTIARDIAEYVHSISYSDIDKQTLNNAKRLIVDTMGCAIGAFDEIPVKIERETVQDTNGKYISTILGTSRKTDPWDAAFVNGTMSRYFDYNDTYDSKEFSHPSDNIMPIFAIAEAEGKGGKEALIGCVLAYELQARLADSANLWKKGWDHVIYGLVSVSAAASKVMGLNVDKTEQAINIALSSHITMRQVRVGELSMWKAVSFANAARNAIFAAALAKNGMTGPSPIFEGSMGLFKQITGEFKFDTSQFGSRKNEFKINKNLMKYFPAETRTQTAIFAALELRKRIKSVDEIKNIVIEAGEATVKVIGKEREKWDPKTKETADHSIPYIVAAALMDGNVDTSTFQPKRFRDKKTLDLMKKITVKEMSKYTELYNKGGTVNAANIILKLNDGRKLEKEVLYSRGHWKNPMANSEIEDKFKRLTKKHLNIGKTMDVLSILWNFEKLREISYVFQMLAFEK